MSTAFCDLAYPLIPVYASLCETHKVLWIVACTVDTVLQFVQAMTSDHIE